MIKDTKNRLRLPIFERPAPHDTPIDARDAKTPEPPKFLRPPEGAPNILVILIDDMGFGASSAFGGPCEMPHAEQLMKEGTALTRFHTTALCSPTRQALLTGRNHHTVNMGAIAEIATSKIPAVINPMLIILTIFFILHSLWLYHILFAYIESIA